MPQGQTLTDAFSQDLHLRGGTSGRVGRTEFIGDAGNKLFVVPSFHNLVKNVVILRFGDFSSEPLIPFLFHFILLSTVKARKTLRASFRRLKLNSAPGADHVKGTVGKNANGSDGESEPKRFRERRTLSKGLNVQNAE